MKRKGIPITSSSTQATGLWNKARLAREWCVEEKKLESFRHATKRKLWWIPVPDRSQRLRSQAQPLVVPSTLSRGFHLLTLESQELPPPEPVPFP